MTKSIFFIGTDFQSSLKRDASDSSGKSEPLYLRLYESVSSAIRCGNLTCGEKLPSLRNMSARLGISRNTVEGAYAQLVSEGYVENLSRRGYFVCGVEPVFTVPPPTVAKTPATPAAETVAKTALISSAANLIDLSSNRIDSSLFPVSVLRRLYRLAVSSAADGDLLQRGEVAGDAVFREAIARYLRASRGVRCSASQVIVGAGSEYLLPLAVRLLRGDVLGTKIDGSGLLRFAVEDPGYEKTRLLLNDCGCPSVPIPLDEAGISAAALAKSGARAVYVTPAHQFPAGIVMPVTRRFEILNWAAKTNSWIIEDDYDSDYRYNGRQVPALQGLGADSRVVYLGTFSRSLSPSIRVGYLVLPESLVGIQKRLCERYSCTVSRLEQAVLASFISGGFFERHINRTRRVYRQRRDAAISFLQESIPGIRISGAEAGLHFIAEIPLKMPPVAYIKRVYAGGAAVKIIEPDAGSSAHSPHCIRLIIGYAHLEKETLRCAAEILGKAVRE